MNLYTVPPNVLVGVSKRTLLGSVQSIHFIYFCKQILLSPQNDIFSKNVILFSFYYCQFLLLSLIYVTVRGRKCVASRPLHF